MVGDVGGAHDLVARASPPHRPILPQRDEISAAGVSGSWSGLRKPVAAPR